MKRELINKSVLLALVLLISALFLDMIRQFLMPMFMAGIFSAIVSPAHRWLTARIGGRENLASVLVIVGIVVLVLVPLSILIGVVVGQAISVSQSPPGCSLLSTSPPPSPPTWRNFPIIRKSSRIAP